MGWALVDDASSKARKGGNGVAKNGSEGTGGNGSVGSGSGLVAEL